MSLLEDNISATGPILALICNLKMLGVDVVKQFAVVIQESARGILNTSSSFSGRRAKIAT